LKKISELKRIIFFNDSFWLFGADDTIFLLNCCKSTVPIFLPLNCRISNLGMFFLHPNFLGLKRHEKSPGFGKNGQAEKSGTFSICGVSHRIFQ